MGNGDNRRSRKMKQRKAWRKLKERIARRIKGGKGSTAPAAAKTKAAPATKTVKK